MRGPEEVKHALECESQQTTSEEEDYLDETGDELYTDMEEQSD